MHRTVLSSSVDGELIRYVARCLATADDVEVFVSVSDESYRRDASGGVWRRISLRWRMYVWHPCRLMMKLLLTPSRTVFFVTSNPFFLPFAVAWVGRFRNQRVIQIVYDLFPDALEEAGMIRRNGIRARMLGLLTSSALRRCELTVFLGEQLQVHAERRWGKANRSVVIPVVLSETAGAEPRGALEGPLKIWYGGQLGWMHDAELLAELLRFFEKTGPPEVRAAVCWSFRISGAKAAEFSQAVSDLEIEVGPTVPADEWRRMVLGSEVGLVTLSEGGARVCLPSKTFGMMACGMAILAICPGSSDLAQFLRQSDSGWIVDTSGGDSGRIKEDFTRTIGAIVSDPKGRLRRARNARAAIAAQNRLDLKEHRWCRLLDPPDER